MHSRTDFDSSACFIGMPDINTPDALSDQRPDVAGSSTILSDQQIYPIDNHATKPLLTKGLITTKGWTLSELVKKSQNFHPVNRVHFKDRDLLQTIRKHEEFGVPLIVQGFHEHEGWPADLFTLDWLSEHGKPCKTPLLMLEHDLMREYSGVCA